MNRSVLLALHWLCRLSMAAIFFLSGIIKVRAPMEFAASLYKYDLLPDYLIMPVAQCFPWLEIVLAVLLLIGWKMRYWAIAASALLLFFISLLTLTYLRGIEADCGCFGSGEMISPLTILRDSLMLLPALYLVLEGKLRKRYLVEAQ